MGAYEPKDFLTLKGTLLSYTGSSETLQIPANMDRLPISAVGKGALADCGSLKRVIVPEQIRRVGDRAFFNCKALETVAFNGEIPELGILLFQNCPKLKQILLHGLPVSEEEYRQLLNNSCPMEDGSLAAECFPLWPSLGSLKNTLPVKPYVRVPKAVNCLLRDEMDMPTQDGEDSRRFLDLILRGIETPGVAEAEEENDLRLRRENVPNIENLALFSVDDRKTARSQKGRLLHARILLGRFYWQAKVRVVCDQQAYYLYQRNYLSSDAKLEYVRKDMGVFTREGPVREERTVGDVWAKYQLCSIL